MNMVKTEHLIISVPNNGTINNVDWITLTIQVVERVQHITLQLFQCLPGLKHSDWDQLPITFNFDQAVV